MLVGLVVGYFVFVYKETMLLEEEELYDRHGREWERYLDVTPALLPRWEDVRSVRFKDLKSFQFERFEVTREWNNFLGFLAIFLVLWLKLIYRLY